MVKTHLFLLLIWLGYFALHSFLAHQKIKNLVNRYLGKYFRFYRIFFNIVSIVLLLLILKYQFSLPKESLFQSSMITSLIGIFVFIVGVLILGYSFYTFNLSEFFGFQQMKAHQDSQVKEEKELVKSGLYAYVRHPLYFGVIVLLLGALLYLPYYSTLAFVLATYLYLPFGVSLEENKLVDEFGSKYKTYQKEVKMLIPFIF